MEVDDNSVTENSDLGREEYVTRFYLLIVVHTSYLRNIREVFI